MTVGLQFMRSVIDNGSRTALRDVSEDLFKQEELPAWEFLGLYYRRHGGLPTLQIMRENGYDLPFAEGAVSYYSERLRSRAIYTVAQQNIPQIQQALLARNVDEVRELIGQMNISVGHFDGRESVHTLHDLATQVMEQYQQARMEGTGMIGVTLGDAPLDEVTAGAQPGDVVSYVARPNVGKSWKLIKIANDAWEAGHSVGFVSMEMTDFQIARRVIGLSAGINPDNIRRGRMSSHAEDVVHEVIDNIPGRAPFHIMSGNFKKSTADIDRLVGEFMPDIVYVDASYLVGSAKKQRANGARWERVYDVGEEIKEIATDRNLPIVQTLQANRSKKKGESNDLDQIAGGDVIGQISSVVVMLDKGDGVQEHTVRKNVCMKNRDGQLTDYQTNFLFDPMNMDYIEGTIGLEEERQNGTASATRGRENLDATDW